MSNEQVIKVPDIGGVSGVEVIELLVKVGEQITKDTVIVTLESDKASMDIPAGMDGEVSAIAVKLGDKISEGDVLLTLVKTTSTESPSVATSSEVAVLSEPEIIAPAVVPAIKEEPKLPEVAKSLPVTTTEDTVLAGPSARRLARVLGVELSKVVGSGVNARVSKSDVESYVKQRLTQPQMGAVPLSAPVIDFSQWGEIEKKTLNKIKRITGSRLHYSWTTIPHVTQFDMADITELESFRKAEVARANATGVKLTLLAFVCKVVSQALAVFPQFNSSLSANGEELIYKKYCHIGIAVETPQGLVVPVIKNVDQLSIYEIANEMARLSQKAREKGLSPAEMTGGCFTISSLGGIGGTAFTPVVNHPEVAILGLSRSSMQPVYENGTFVPRLMLPLSLSYDHRVIDGAEGARFTRYLSDALNDIRRILL